MRDSERCADRDHIHKQAIAKLTFSISTVFLGNWALATNVTSKQSKEQEKAK